MEKILTKEKIIEDIQKCFSLPGSSDPYSLLNPSIALHRLIKEYLNSGYPKEKLLDDLSDYASFLYEQKNRREEDIVMDGVDMLSGYVSEEWKL